MKPESRVKHVGALSRKIFEEVEESAKWVGRGAHLAIEFANPIWMISTSSQISSTFIIIIIVCFFFLIFFFHFLSHSVCLSVYLPLKIKEVKQKKNDVYKYNFFSVSLAALSYSSPFSSSHLPSPTDRSGFSYLDLLNVPHSLQNRGFRLICATSSICRLSTHGFNVDGGGDDSCLSILDLMRLDDLIWAEHCRLLLLFLVVWLLFWFCLFADWYQGIDSFSNANCECLAHFRVFHPKHFCWTSSCITRRNGLDGKRTQARVNQIFLKFRRKWILIWSFNHHVDVWAPFWSPIEE